MNCMEEDRQREIFEKLLNNPILLAKDAVADTTALAQFDKADSPVTYKWKEPLNVTPTATAD